jgi:uncharacterized LabA/DUF88 family protein
MTPVRAALYLDFDNVYSGLAKLDPEAAVVFAQNPAVWLDRLTEQLTVDGPRRWLILRCYMNPSGWVPDPSAPGRQYFSKFRQSLTSAGFEVVDCPRLAHTKNAADIRLVVDALDALAGRVQYDEFIVASGDSDMTPLLVRLRADDRRITLLSPFDAVEALASVADRLINGQQLLELLQEEPAGADDVSQGIAVAAGSHGIDRSDDLALFDEIVRGHYAASPEPINLASLAQEVHDKVGSGAKASEWFGNGSFARAISRLALPNAEVGGHHLWDTSRHQPPPPGSGPPGPAAINVPEAVARVSTALRVPRLPSTAWPAIAGVLADYARTHHFNMTEATAWSRDRLAENSTNVGREAVGFAVRATAYGGQPLYQDPAPGQGEIIEAVISNILSRAAAAELDLEDDEAETIRSWFRGEVEG